MDYRVRSGKRFAVAAIAVLGLSISSLGFAADDSVTDRVVAAGHVIAELANAASGIPTDTLNQAECVIILPSVKKAGFIVGASYGRGLMTCRSGAHFKGPWGPPTMMQSSGGSFGLQAGAQSTDFVVLVMNDAGARALLKGKAKLGADASIAAGPVGRDAEASTNASMNAQMLSYSRAQGVFAGVSLSGTSLGPDNDANEKLYGKKVTATDIVANHAVTMPAEAKELISVLTKKSPANISRGK